MARARTHPLTNLSDLDKGGHGGFTLALAPPFFGGLGFLLDSGLGWTPILTIVGALYGLGGGVYKVVGDYRTKMAAQDRTPEWARTDNEAELPAGAGQ